MNNRVNYKPGDWIKATLLVCVCVLLTLHHQLDQSLSGFYIEAVVLARLAAVSPAHLSAYVAEPQDAIVAFRLS